MAIGTAADFVIPDECEGRVMPKRVLDSSYIVLSGDSVASDATVGTVVGTLSVTAAYTGTPIWQLVNDENGKFSVNSSTGVVTVAGDLSALDSASIKAKVRGISQQIFDRTFELTLSGGGGGSFEGPLDIVSGAVLAWGQRALSANRLGQPVYSIKRTSDGTIQSFSADSDTGDAPVSAITSFIGSSSFQTTADVVNGSQSIDPIDTSGIAVGQSISGADIPDNTFVVSIGASAITISNAPTGDASSVTLTFTQRGNFDTWFDQSGSGYDIFTQNDNLFSWVQNAIGTRTGFFQLGSFTTTEDEVPFTTGGGVSVFMVAVRGGGTLESNSTPSYLDFSIRQNGSGYTDAYDGTNNVGGSISWTHDNSPHVFELHWQNGSNEFLIDGAAQTSDTSTDTGALGDITISGAAPNLGFCNSDGQAFPGSEMIIWPYIASSELRASIRQNLADYYGISL